MPADRFFHARLGHSAKVSSLSDLEYRVWTTYVLAADDFGVMRADAVAFQAAHDALSTRPAGEVAAGIERVREVGLVETFEHQGARYLFQADWQDFQRVRFPTRTLQPVAGFGEGQRADAPPVVRASRRNAGAGATEELRHHFRTISEVVPQKCGRTSAQLPKRFGTDSGQHWKWRRTAFRPF